VALHPRTTLHPKIKRTSIEWEFVDGNPTCVLVVETDMELRSHVERFSSSELEELVLSASEDQEAIGARFAKVRVVPWGGR
jgi:hypothetical protein